MAAASTRLLLNHQADIDPRFEILQSATRVSTADVELVLSYIPLTSFSSIPKFVDYFKTRDVLPIHANQPLEIHDPSFLFQLHQTDPEPLPENAFDKCLIILNKILSLIAKEGFFPAGTKTYVQISPSLFSMQFSSDVTFQTQSSAITIRPKHLFGMMKAYSVSSITFSPNQPLRFIGISEAERKLDSVNLKKWERYAPEDCEITWHFYENVFSCSAGTYRLADIPITQNVYVIEAPKGMTLSLKQPLSVIPSNPHQSKSIIRISEELQLKEDFAFNNPNAVVIIERNITGNGNKVSIVAKNVIVLPTAKLDVDELDVATEGSSVLLNVTANKVNLIAEGDIVLGNSRSVTTKVRSGNNALVFGLNHHTTIDLGRHYEAISRVLQDAIPSDLHHLLPANQLLLT